MDAIARSLHLGGRSSDFYAHLHIVDLYNVPLVEGECKIKWRFKGAMHLNNVERSQILDKAKEGTVGYLRRETTRDPLSSSSKGKGKERTSSQDSQQQRQRGDSEDELVEQDNSNNAGGHSSGRRLASFGKAILHPKSAALSLRRRSNTRENSPTNNTSEVPPADIQEDYLNNSMNGRTPRASQMNGFSPYSSTGPLSPAETIHAGPLSSSSPVGPSPPSRISTRLSYGSTGNRESTEYARINGTGHLSRMSTTLSSSQSRALGLSDSANNSPTAASKPFEPVTDSKGHTKYLSLVSNACQFDQHVICAVAIPLDKATNHLQACPVRLAVKHKVRVTPLSGVKKLGEKDSAVNGNSTDSRNNASSSPSSRNHNTSPSPSSSSTSLLHPSSRANVKEEHEEIPLGEVTLDLSEFVEAGRSAKQSERWTTRRYLLQNGKTNALLRIAVKMEWLGGEAYYVPPPLTTGQIIKQTKRDRSGSKNDNSSTHHSNGSSLMVHSNSSHRSLSSSNGDAASRLRPPSVSMNSDSPSSSKGSRGRPMSQSSAKQRLQNKVNDTQKQQGAALTATSSSNGLNVRNSDQQAIDLIEEIFDSKVRSTPISQSPNFRKSRKAADANHGYEVAAKNNVGAKAIMDANPHHNPEESPHRGYHPQNDKQGLHNMQNMVKDVMEAPTEAQMIAKQALRKHKQEQRRKGGSGSDTNMRSRSSSPSKLKRRSDKADKDARARATSNPSFLKRPFAGNRTVSSSSSMFSRKNTVSSQDDSEAAQRLRKGMKRVMTNGSEDQTPTVGRNGVELHPGQKSESMQRSGTQDSLSDSTRNEASSSGAGEGASGKSSPIKQKSVSWEDAPPADKEQIDAILRQVALRQEEREARQGREASHSPKSSRNSSRPSSVRTGSSRTNSPERVLAPTTERTLAPNKMGGFEAVRPKTSPAANSKTRFPNSLQEAENNDEDGIDRKRAQSLRERGLLPSIALTTSANE